MLISFQSTVQMSLEETQKPVFNTKRRDHGAANAYLAGKERGICVHLSRKDRPKDLFGSLNLDVEGFTCVGADSHALLVHSDYELAPGVCGTENEGVPLKLAACLMNRESLFILSTS